MKTALRMFALALVATGAFATLHAAGNSSMNGKVSAPPIPMCPPDDKDACNIDRSKSPPVAPPSALQVVAPLSL